MGGGKGKGGKKGGAVPALEVSIQKTIFYSTDHMPFFTNFQKRPLGSHRNSLDATICSGGKDGIGQPLPPWMRKGGKKGSVRLWLLKPHTYIAGKLPRITCIFREAGVRGNKG